MLREAESGARHVEETGARAEGVHRARPEQICFGRRARSASRLAIHVTRDVVGGRATLIRHYTAVPRVTACFARLSRAFACLLRNAAEAIPPNMPHANAVSVRTSFR